MEALSTAAGHSPSLPPSHRNTLPQRLPGLLAAFHRLHVFFPPLRIPQKSACHGLNCTKLWSLVHLTFASARH